MRKILTSLVIIAFLVLIGYGTVFAIQGACVNCHTMHNSQNGTRMADRDTPYEYLLRAGCISCHSQQNPGEGQTNAFSAPIVWHTQAPGGQGDSDTNAGGDFYWVGTLTQDGYGHNVLGVAAQDQVINQNNPGWEPPGWDNGANPDVLTNNVTSAGSWTQQLNCAGTWGCHGDRSASGDFPGISGAHHNNPSISATVADGSTTVGGSYRFLPGIDGFEDTNWNWGETNVNHNEYCGVDDTSARDGTTQYSNKRTISFSCANCHGIFHSDIDIDDPAASPWTRHPTDIYLPNSGEYSDYNPDGGGLYSLEAPVARDCSAATPTTKSSTVTPGSDVVACISCHRAHGSPEPDILRWTYSGMIAGSGTSDTGCFVCHTTKNGD